MLGECRSERVLLELNCEDSPEALIYIMVTTAPTFVTVQLANGMVEAVIALLADHHSAKTAVTG